MQVLWAMEIEYGNPVLALNTFRSYTDTAISKKVVIVNSQYWNLKELWVQS